MEQPIKLLLRSKKGVGFGLVNKLAHFSVPDRVTKLWLNTAVNSPAQLNSRKGIIPSKKPPLACIETQYIKLIMACKITNIVQ